MTEQQSAITRGFARAIGPFLILFAAVVAMRSSEMGLLATGFFQDAPLELVTGAFTLAIGCAMLAAHHHVGSLAAIIVTIFSVLTAVRGLVLLVSPRFLAPVAAHLVDQPGVIFIPAAVALLIGFYLCFVGWVAKPAA
jgi:hypothetical protein